MTSNSGIPRPFGLTDAKRAREEEARRREQATSARNTSSTTIGSGGRLDVVGGDLTVSEGGNASVKDGGAFRVEGGGSMEIVDDGEIIVTGSTYDALSDVVRVAQVALRTEEITHENVGWTTRRPGIFFSTDGIDGASIHSFGSNDANMVSGIAPVTWGPLVGPDINKSASVYISPHNAVLSAGAFYKTGADVTDSRSQCGLQLDPDAIFLQLYQSNVGEVGSIRVSIADPKLRLYGRDGVDVKGPFTVDGAPVGGAVDSVAGKTGAVTLVKADVGLGNVDNTSDASKPVATTTTNGLLPSTDKAKLDGATPSPTANRIIYRDTSGRAQIADPASGTDIVNYQTMVTAVEAVKPSTWTNIPASTNWEPQASDPPKFRIANGTVFFAGKFHYIGASTTAGVGSATSILMGTLPTGVWPSSEFNTIGMAVWDTGTAGVNSQCRIAIGTDGQMRLYAIGVNGVATDFQVRTRTYVYLSNLFYPA